MKEKEYYHIIGSIIWGLSINIGNHGAYESIWENNILEKRDVIEMQKDILEKEVAEIIKGFR